MRKHPISLITVLGIFVTVLFIVTSSSPAQPALPLAKVKLALNWKPEPEFGGFYAAQLTGAYEKSGLDVEILPGGSGTPTAQMIDAGRADFGIVSADELLTLRSKGGDLVALFTVYQTNPQALMTHADHPATTLQQLLESPGTVAWQAGLPYVAHLKKKFNLKNLQQVPYTGGLPFLKDKNFSQQCFVFSKPLVAQQQGHKVKTFLIADAGYNPYTAVVVTRRQFFNDHPALVGAFARAIQIGWSTYLQDPKPANQAMHKLNPAMDLSLFAAAAEAQKLLIETEETKAHGLGTMTAERWQQLIDQLVEYKILDKPQNPNNCFVPFPPAQ